MTRIYTGPELRELRKRAMLTQLDVVRLTGICETTIWWAENGRRKPQARTLEKMLRLYDERIHAVDKRFRRLSRKTQVRHAPTK